MWQSVGRRDSPLTRVPACASAPGSLSTAGCVPIMSCIVAFERASRYCDSVRDAESPRAARAAVMLVLWPSSFCVSAFLLLGTIFAFAFASRHSRLEARERDLAPPSFSFCVGLARWLFVCGPRILFDLFVACLRSFLFSFFGALLTTRIYLVLSAFVRLATQSGLCVLASRLIISFSFSFSSYSILSCHIRIRG
jgi:hypothetical protein